MHSFQWFRKIKKRLQRRNLQQNKIEKKSGEGEQRAEKGEEASKRNCGGWRVEGGRWFEARLQRLKLELECVFEGI